MTNDTFHPASGWMTRLKRFFTRLPHTTDEFMVLLQAIQARNVITLDSARMIEGVLQVSDMRVDEIMIPRSEMAVIPKDAEYDAILSIVLQSGHSRFPVVGESKEEVIGILLAKDLLLYKTEEAMKKFSLKDILRPAIFVPESKRSNILLNEFRKNRQHIALIVDEYGQVSGLVTIEDVLEQIVGEIEDEHDIEKDLYIRQNKENTYSVKATTPIAEFNRFFNTTLPDEEFDTIGGLVLKGFGHLPKRNEAIDIEGIPFIVLRANNRRIQLLQVTLSIPPSPIEQDKT